MHWHTDMKDAAAAQRVSRAGSRLALVMLAASLALGLVLAAMSAAQLVQVRRFSRQIMSMQARAMSAAFFMRFVRQRDLSPDRVPAVVEEMDPGPASFIQVLDGSGKLLGSWTGDEAGEVDPPPAGSVREVCDRGFDNLGSRLVWDADGTARLRRNLLAALAEPGSVEVHEVGGRPVLDAIFALPAPPGLGPGPLPLPPDPGDAPEPDPPGKGKGAGMVVHRDMLAPGSPCLAVRVGIDATPQRTAMRTQMGMLLLAVLTTLLVLGINIALYRALRQRERMTGQLQAARRVQALGEMAATMAHELKNPVGAIRGYAQLMQETLDAAPPGDRSPDPAASERTRRAIETMVRESRRLEDLVRRTLEFARPGELRTAAADLREIADAAAAMLSRKAEERGVTIIRDHDPSHVTATVDRYRIEQVVVNLLDNAIVASLAGASVVLKVGSSAEGPAIEVRDSGRGIAPDRLESIFQPFHSDRPDGTGLGLAVSRSIVEAHGGTIGCSSDGDGRGARFLVILPR